MPTSILKAQLIGLAISVVLLGLSLFVTNPDRLGPFGITLWFVVLFIALANAFSIAFTLIYRLWTGRRQALLTNLRQASLSSLWLCMLLGLSSLHQLSSKDVALVSLLLVLIEFYMRRSLPVTV